MPQKMIYVAEADLPIYDRAQQLAGGNLSALIARALRLFVQTEEARTSDMRAVAVETGVDGLTQRKQFRGRLLARHREHTPDDELIVRIVYQTAKGKLALYIKTIANWSAYVNSGWQAWDWPVRDYQLQVFETLELLQPHVPAPLFVAVAAKLRGDTPAPEVLDI